jgi:hypothetical protein
VATKKLECGCVIEWPESRNCAAKNRAKAEHEEVCPAWKAIRDRRRADAAAKANTRRGLSRSSFLRGDDERHAVDGYWGDGAYDSPGTTDGMIDEALS